MITSGLDTTSRPHAGITQPLPDAAEAARALGGRNCQLKMAHRRHAGGTFVWSWRGGRKHLRRVAGSTRRPDAGVPKRPTT